MGEQVEMVALAHVHQFAHGVGGVMLAEQMVDELVSLLLLHPQAAKIMDRCRFAQYPLNHFTAVFLQRNRHIPPFTPLQDEPALRGDSDFFATL